MGCSDARFTLVQCAQALIDLFLRYRARRLESLDARGLQLRKLALRSGKRDTRLGASVIGLIRPRIDDDHDFVLADELPFMEQDLIDVTRCTWAYFNRIHRLETAGVLVPVRDSFLQNRRDQHFGQLLCGGGRSAAT